MSVSTSSPITPPSPAIHQVNSHLHMIKRAIKKYISVYITIYMNLFFFPLHLCVIDPKLEEGHSVTQAGRSPLWSRDPRILFPVRATNPPNGKYLKNSKLWSYFQLGSFPMDCQYLLLASAAVFALSQYLTAAMSLLILNHQSQYSRMKSTFETFTPCNSPKQ